MWWESALKRGFTPALLKQWRYWWVLWKQASAGTCFPCNSIDTAVSLVTPLCSQILNAFYAGAASHLLSREDKQGDSSLWVSFCEVILGRATPSVKILFLTRPVLNHGSNCGSSPDYSGLCFSWQCPEDFSQPCYILLPIFQKSGIIVTGKILLIFSLKKGNWAVEVEWKELYFIYFSEGTMF